MSLPRLTKATDGIYRIRWTDDLTGKRRSHNLGTRKRKDAETLYKDFLTNRQESSQKVVLKVSEAWSIIEAIAEDKYATALAVQNLEIAFRPLRTQFGAVAVSEISPRHLLEVRNWMIGQGWTSGTINDRCNRIRRCFKWLVSRQHCPYNVYAALCTVEGIKKHEALRQKPPVSVVRPEYIEATKVVLRTVFGCMVDAQLLTGMRPGEVCSMYPRDVDQSDEIWLYKPPKHKTAHLGKDRVIAIGPRCQAVLARWMRDPELPVFRVADSLRDSKRPWDAVDESIPFKTMSYGLAIRRAVKQAGVPNWSPNQLRHNAATDMRSAFGLEQTSAVLGHSKVETTQIYAEKRLSDIVEVARKFG